MLSAAGSCGVSGLDPCGRGVKREGAKISEFERFGDLAAAVLDGDSAQLCRLLDQKQIPHVIYSAREQVDEECAEGTFIRKPASVEEVVASVERLLGTRKPDNYETNPHETPRAFITTA